MQPSSRQLLKQLRNAVQQLQRDAPEQQALLGAMGIVVNELMLRTNVAFFAEHYREGRALLEEGGQLLANSKGRLLRVDGLPGMLDISLSSDAIGKYSLALTAALEDLVNAIGHTSDAARQSLLRRIHDWELKLFAYRLEQAPANTGSDASRTFSITQQDLAAYLQRKKPEWKNLEITDFRQLASGFSKCTILFDTVDSVNGRQSFAIRAEQPVHLLDIDGSNVVNEFPVLQAAFAAGLPVAEPMWLEQDTGQLNTRFIISRKASGVNFGTAKGGEGKLSVAVVKDLARVLARIHNIPLRRSDAWVDRSHFGKWLDYGMTTRANTLARIADWRKQARDAKLFPSPVIARAMNWVEANVPDQDDPVAFLHGDFGPHNILIDGDRVTGVLDWEISTPGDPAYDLCWFLNCAGTSVDREQFLDAYREAGGRPVTEYQLRYFEVFPCMFMPITCNAALRQLEDHDYASINFAVYGLQFMHEYPSRLDAAIERAEAAKKRA